MNLFNNINAKRRILLFAFLFLTVLSSFSQYWERFLGGPDTYEYIYDMDEAYDKGLIRGTVLVDDIPSNYKTHTRSSFIYKTDINGETLWYRNFRNDPLLIYSSRSVGDGTIVAQFASWNYENETFCILLARIDECGNKLWCRNITDYSADAEGFATYDIEIINNRIVFCRENYNISLDTKYSIVMYDLDGEKICEKPFLFYKDHPLMISPWLKHLQPLPNNEFLLTGQTYYRATPSSPAWLRALFVKFDAEGNEQWVLPFGLNDTIVSCQSNCENVILEENERYFAFNSTYSNTNPIQLLLMKFDDNGFEDGFELSEIDTVFIDGNSPYFAGAIKVSENRYLNVMKYHFQDDPDHFGNAMVVVDSLIETFHDTLHLKGYHLTVMSMGKTFNDKYFSGGFDVQTSDVQAYLNKITISPLSFDTIDNSSYIYDSQCNDNIVYSDTIYFDDCLPVGNNIFDNGNSTKYPIHFYPNPAQEELSISFGAKAYTTPITITIHTLTGEKKWQGTLALGEQTKRLSVYSWPKGIYIVTARKENEVVGREKVVVM